MTFLADDVVWRRGAVGYEGGNWDIALNTSFVRD
jgi:hypothetical protein